MTILSGVILYVASMEGLSDTPRCSVAQYHVILLYTAADFMRNLRESLGLPSDSIFWRMLYQVWFGSLLVYLCIFPINYIQSPTCMTPLFRQMCFFYALPFLMVFALMFCGMVFFGIYMGVVLLYKKSKEKSVRADLKRNLESSLIDPRRLRDFYLQNEFIINNVEIYPEELVFYKDNFTVRFSPEINRFGESTCPVCMGDFEPEGLCTLHPKCKHLFHSDCLELWIVKHKNCPICKEDFRKGFVEDLILKAENQFIVQRPPPNQPTI